MTLNGSMVDAAWMWRSALRSSAISASEDKQVAYLFVVTMPASKVTRDMFCYFDQKGTEGHMQAQRPAQLPPHRHSGGQEKKSRKKSQRIRCSPFPARRCKFGATSQYSQDSMSKAGFWTISVQDNQGSADDIEGSN
jgi:hypothetical protein